MNTAAVPLLAVVRIPTICRIFDGGALAVREEVGVAGGVSAIAASEVASKAGYLDLFALRCCQESRVARRIALVAIPEISVQSRDRNLFLLLLGQQRWVAG